jgi:hypothetical protein
MKKSIAIFMTLFGISCQQNSIAISGYELDYDKMVFLDAESLAEQGIMEAYDELKIELSRYVDESYQVEEIIDHDAASYAVSFQNNLYEIYGPTLIEDEGQSWGRATHAFFEIVNLQLENGDVRFYAINGGNDLGGIFLTVEQYRVAIGSLSRKTDWPYMPKLKHPWYGQQN